MMCNCFHRNCFLRLTVSWETQEFCFSLTKASRRSRSSATCTQIDGQMRDDTLFTGKLKEIICTITSGMRWPIFCHLCPFLFSASSLSHSLYKIKVTQWCKMVTWLESNWIKLNLIELNLKDKDLSHKSIALLLDLMLLHLLVALACKQQSSLTKMLFICESSSQWVECSSLN